MKPLALMVTRRCTMSCGHCSVESTPKLREQPDVSELLDRVDQAATGGITQILLTGGEPMMRYEVCLQLIERARRRGMKVLMVSNGFWGKQAAEAERKLVGLMQAGLSRLSLSYDRYHHEFQGPEPLSNIVRAAQSRNFLIDLVVTRNRDDEDLETFIQPFRGAPNVQFRFYDVQSVGAARKLDGEQMRGEMGGHCSSCAFPAVTDDGRLTACNGPAYFSAPGSPLRVGHLAEQPLAELLELHRQDVILETIRTQGPSQLQRELLEIPGFQDYPFKASYSGVCELCLQITADARAVAALRERLGEESSRARREAIRLVSERASSSGRFNRETVNTGGIVQLLLQLRSRPHWDEAGTILGRADLDWSSLLERVVRAGLAAPLLEFEGQWQRWAPRFFLKTLYRQAAQDGLRAQLQQEELHSLDQELQRRGQTAVLLGGCGLAQLSKSRAYSQVRVWRGGPLYARHWRFPEREIWEEARSLPDFRALKVLSPEAQLLTCAWDCSNRLFSNGLQAAWDVHSIGTVDYGVVERWAARSAAPRACWVPLQAMGVKAPTVKADRRQSFLLQVAGRQLFARRVHPQASDPWLRLACDLLLHEKLGGQLGCLVASLPRLWGHSPAGLIALARSKVRRR